MLVREVMTTAVVTVGPATALKEAAQLLSTHRVTSLPVVDDAGVLVGILSEADVVGDALVPDQRRHLLRIPVREGPGVTRVAEAMSTDPISVGPDADLADAVAIMLSRGFKSLPVVVHDVVVGIVSRTDVIGQLARRDDQLARDVLALMRRQGLDWTVDVDDGVVSLTGPTGEQERALAEALVLSVRGVLGLHFEVEGP